MPTPRTPKEKPVAVKHRKEKPLPVNNQATQDAINKPIVSLLDPRNEGWEIIGVWPGLFTLYVKGDESKANLSPELVTIEECLSRGHSSTDKDAFKVEGEMTLLALQYMVAKEDKSDCVVKGFGVDVFKSLASSLGSVVFKIESSKNEAQAELAACELGALMKKVASGLVRKKFPKKARGSGWSYHRERIAIWNARILCEHLRRLPTKSEVRHRLEAIGIEWPNQGWGGKWGELFEKAGLSGLPD